MYFISKISRIKRLQSLILNLASLSNCRCIMLNTKRHEDIHANILQALKVVSYLLLCKLLKYTGFII